MLGRRVGAPVLAVARFRDRCAAISPPLESPIATSGANYLVRGLAPLIAGFADGGCRRPSSRR